MSSPDLKKKKSKNRLLVSFQNDQKRRLKKFPPPKKLPFAENFFFRRIPDIFISRKHLQSIPLGRFRGGRVTQKVSHTKPEVQKSPGMSGSQAGPRGPGVTEGGECDRIMYAGSDKHTVRHTWRLDKERGLQLTTELKDKRTRGGRKLVSKKHFLGLAALGDFLGRRRLPKGEPTSGGPGRRAWVHWAEAGVCFLRVQRVWFREGRGHPLLQGAGNVRAAGEVDEL